MLDWAPYYRLNDPAQCWQFIYQASLDEIHKTVSSYRNIYKKKLKPIWMDDYLLHLVNERDTQFKKARRTDVHSDWADEKLLRNLVKKGINEARANYVKANLDTYKNDSKKVWLKLKEILPDKINSNKFNLVDQMTRQKIDVPVIDTANYINRFFSEVGPKLAEKLQDSDWQNTMDLVHSTFNLNRTNSDDVRKLVKQSV